MFVAMLIYLLKQTKNNPRQCKRKEAIQELGGPRSTNKCIENHHMKPKDILQSTSFKVMIKSGGLFIVYGESNHTCNKTFIICCPLSKGSAQLGFFFVFFFGLQRKLLVFGFIIFFHAFSFGKKKNIPTYSRDPGLLCLDNKEDLW